MFVNLRLFKSPNLISPECTTPRFYCEEADLGEVIVQTTESTLISKKDSNWSANKLVVLSECCHLISCDLMVMS